MRLTDKVLYETVHAHLIVDGYPPTTEDVANLLAINDIQRVHEALMRARARGKLKLKGTRWFSTQW
ncbi:hypothetical protein AN214_00657 [Pseudoalteromonas sp. P1-9]|nr:hypothetical protein AN214_00657 [Pseudoalteromonas sp. P1-9]